MIIEWNAHIFSPELSTDQTSQGILWILCRFIWIEWHRKGLIELSWYIQNPMGTTTD